MFDERGSDSNSEIRGGRAQPTSASALPTAQPLGGWRDTAFCYALVKESPASVWQLKQSISPSKTRLSSSYSRNDGSQGGILVVPCLSLAAQLAIKELFGFNSGAEVVGLDREMAALIFGVIVRHDQLVIDPELDMGTDSSDA